MHGYFAEVLHVTIPTTSCPLLVLGGLGFKAEDKKQAGQRAGAFRAPARPQTPAVRAFTRGSRWRFSARSVERLPSCTSSNVRSSRMVAPFYLDAKGRSCHFRARFSPFYRILTTHISVIQIVNSLITRSFGDSYSILSVILFAVAKVIAERRKATWHRENY